MPGGNIVFNIGICDVFDNVDQIAMVMGHEISHVLLRHSLRQASKKLINIMTMLFGFISLEFGFMYAWGFEYMESVYKLKQSRVHESRADENGLKLCQRAGYDINESPNMILKFQEQEMMKDKEFQALNVNKKHEEAEGQLKKNYAVNHLMETFQTHPCHSHRFEDLKEQIKELNAKSDDVKQQVILKSITDNDRKTLKGLNDKYMKLRPHVTKYNQLKSGKAAASADKGKLVKSNIVI